MEDLEKVTEIPEDMVLVEGGTFQMGDQFGDGGDDEKPVHTVTLSDFYLGIHEVTFEEFDLFCAATDRARPDDRGWGRGKRPVINLDWYDAIEYCNRRSREEGLQEVYRIDKSRSDPNNSRDPKGPSSGASRVLRGGSWLNGPADVRVAYRRRSTPDGRYNSIGFRLARAGH